MKLLCVKVASELTRTPLLTFCILRGEQFVPQVMSPEQTAATVPRTVVDQLRTFTGVISHPYSPPVQVNQLLYSFLRSFLSCRLKWQIFFFLNLDWILTLKNEMLVLGPSRDFFQKAGLQRLSVRQEKSTQLPSGICSGSLYTPHT